MKLRFHDNSLRLRLTQPEVTRLAQGGSVENVITFGPGQKLTYSIETAPVPQLSAAFESARIRVLVPAAAASSWAGNDEQVGIESKASPLSILVEKDFQCLHRPAEAEPGAFPNPLANR